VSAGNHMRRRKLLRRSRVPRGLHARTARDDHPVPSHVSVAYISAPGPAQPIASALQNATPEAVTTAIDSASVLTFHRDNRLYEWTAATECATISAGVRIPYRLLKRAEPLTISHSS
jgi:hypothetical protein